MAGRRRRASSSGGPRRGPPLVVGRLPPPSIRELGLAFDEALAAIDMATVLPTPERDAADDVAALQAARETLTRLGAAPFLARLEAAVGASTAVPPAVDRDRASSRTAGVPSAG